MGPTRQADRGKKHPPKIGTDAPHSPRRPLGEQGREREQDRSDKRGNHELWIEATESTKRQLSAANLVWN